MTMVKIPDADTDPGGRPLKYTDPNDLITAIKEYFTACDIGKRPYTITGLGISIGLSRKQMIEYSGDDRHLRTATDEQKKKFRNTIKEAKAKCALYAEEQMYRDKNVSGVIFVAKNNYGFTDQTEIKVSGKVGVEGELSPELLEMIGGLKKATD